MDRDAGNIVRTQRPFRRDRVKGEDNSKQKGLTTMHRKSLIVEPMTRLELVTY